MHKKRKMFFMLMVLSLLLCGCGDHELENRSFPLAVGLESEKQGCRVVFNFPVLSEVANENADGSYTAVASKKGRDFFTIQKNYEKNSSKSIDFSHNKALILSEEFLKDEEKLQKFLEYAKTQELMARNTYLFVTDLKMEHLFGLDQNLEKPLGTYLEELLESDEDYKDKRIMTLGRLYDERQNQMETLYIPVLGEKDKEPEVTGFYVLRNGKAKERVSSELAMESMLLQGKLKGSSYQDAAGCEWRITKIHPSYEFEKNIEHPIIKIHLACTASLENATLTDWKHEETLERTLEEELQNRLNTDAKAALEKGIDISNSYKKLGNSYRKGYVYYEERREEYEKNLQIKVETEVSVVNLK